MADEQNGTPATPATTAASRYAQLETERSPYLTRARDISKLTVPALMPDEGSNGSTTLPTPWTSIGTRGVVNLASKLLLVLFPPGESFAKLALSPKVKDELKATAQSGDADPVAIFEGALSKQEQAVMDRLEETGARPILFEAFKQIIGCGNVLIQITGKGKLVQYRLDSYVCKRDREGNVLEIILQEKVARVTLTGDARTIADNMASGSDPRNEEDIVIHTWVRRDPKTPSLFRVHQEIKGVVIPGTNGRWPVDKSPMIAVATNRQSGESYGRSHAENSLGDLVSLDGLMQSVVEGAAGMAKILWMVEEGGVTDKDMVAKADNNAVMHGRAADVTVVRADKAGDFTVAKSTVDQLEQRISQSFLLTSSIQRQAERVTAEEIRLLAAELEDTLGGMYSLLSQELQAPVFNRVYFVMQRAGELPALPKGTVKTQIVTGLAALGRSHDIQKLDTLLAGIAELAGPQAVAEYVNIGSLIQRRATALGVDTSGLIRSEADVQQQRQAAAARELANKVGPDVVKAGADMMQQNQQPQGQQPAPPTQ